MITIERAIEIKLRTGQAFLETDPDEIDAADKLSIEALKERQEAINQGLPLWHDLLPGETK